MSEKHIFQKSMFSRNEDIGKIAFINWRMDNDSDVSNLFNMAEGYMNSAIILNESCLFDNRDKKADIVAFCILNNFNHGIELYLKALIHLFNKALKNNLKLDGTHNLKQLFDTLVSRIKDKFGIKSSNEFKKSNLNISVYINELYSLTGGSQKNDKMDFSRYPFSKNGENHFYIEDFKNVEIDLEKSIETINRIYEQFEKIFEYYYFDVFEQEIQ